MDHRSHPRVIVDKHIACDGGERRASVFMYDLSIGGCMVETADSPLEVGEVVTLKLASASQPGKVVWAAGGCAGVKFAQDLHGAIVEHYGFTPSAARFEEIAPKDRLGRPLPPLSKQCV